MRFASLESIEGFNTTQMLMGQNRSKVKPNVKDIDATNYIQLLSVYSLKSSRDSLSAAARSFHTVCMDTITSNNLICAHNEYRLEIIFAAKKYFRRAPRSSYHWPNSKTHSCVAPNSELCAIIKTVSWVCLTFSSRFSRVQGVFVSRNVINSGIVMSQDVEAHCITRLYRRVCKMEFQNLIQSWNSLFCAGMFRKRSRRYCKFRSWISFYILPQPKWIRLSHFPISLPHIFHVLQCSHTFLPAERSERATKLAEHLEIFRTKSNDQFQFVFGGPLGKIQKPLVRASLGEEKIRKKKDQTAELCKK